MGICFNHIYFRPKISAACFKISFSILNCWFSFRSRISSSCSGVRLSFSWKEPELDACFTHLSNREVAMSYSRQISHLRLPERYSSTSCCLNSSVYLRGFRRCFCSVIKSAPSCIYYRLYDLKKSVQLIVTYPTCRYALLRLSLDKICSIRLLASMRSFLSVSLDLTIFYPIGYGRCCHFCNTRHTQTY